MPMHVLAVLSGTPGDAVVLRGSMRAGGGSDKYLCHPLATQFYSNQKHVNDTISHKPRPFFYRHRTKLRANYLLHQIRKTFHIFLFVLNILTFSTNNHTFSLVDKNHMCRPLTYSYTHKYACFISKNSKVVHHFL